MFSVLLVEDLEECQTVVRRALSGTDITLTIAETVKDALSLLRSDSRQKYSLVILDQGLPDGEGITILEEIRSKEGDKIPVFLLTSHGELDAKVMAFNLGADDYLVKPISGIELRARIEMRIKKTNGEKKGTATIKKDRLVLDLSLLRASMLEGDKLKALPLTAKEFKILAFLAQHENEVYSRQDLVEKVWGDAVHVLERTVDSHIFGLRKKLGGLAGYIECIPNVGYRFISAPVVSKKADAS